MRRRPKIQPFEEFCANWQPPLDNKKHASINSCSEWMMRKYDKEPRDERDRMKEEG